MPKLNGLNHITLSVSNLEKSFEFYNSVLGFNARVKWKRGAYLSLGNLWLCLSLGEVCAAQDYTHIALDISQKEFSAFKAVLAGHRVSIWKENVSEGNSVYFLDPDGHKLEVHTGSLHSRLKSLHQQPYEDIEFF